MLAETPAPFQHLHTGPTWRKCIKDIIKGETFLLDSLFLDNRFPYKNIVNFFPRSFSLESPLKKNHRDLLNFEPATGNL